MTKPTDHALLDTYDLVDEKRQHCHDRDLPHSLALLPADLEVAIPSSSEKEVYIEEKQPVPADIERCQSAAESTPEKEVLETPVTSDGWHAPWSGRSMPKRICGLRAKVFWILLVSAVVVFCLGIGIGMGTSKLKGSDDDA